MRELVVTVDPNHHRVLQRNLVPVVMDEFKDLLKNYNLFGPTFGSMLVLNVNVSHETIANRIAICREIVVRYRDYPGCRITWNTYISSNAQFIQLFLNVGEVKRSSGLREDSTGYLNLETQMTMGQLLDYDADNDDIASTSLLAWMADEYANNTSTEMDWDEFLATFTA
jgi:hypothetical protein